MNPTEKKKSGIANRGFGSMSEDKHKEIASKGGKKISANRQHMSEIGRKGGEKSGLLRKEKEKQNNTNQTPQS